MEIKDTRQATVRIGYDGNVYKRYHGDKARERYENEVRVLRYLEKKGCPFVPVILKEDPEEKSIVTTNCGKIVDKISQSKMESIFQE